MDDDVPDHVRDYRLETQFPKKREIVHIYDDPDAPPSSQRRLECWKSEKQPIGHGGQGKVFLQKCTSGSRHYTQRAVKVIPLQDASGRRRYIRELETMVKFSHDKYSKYFVKSLGWYESNNSLCIAMQYFPMGDLEAYLLDHPLLPENDTCQITSQVLRGLAIMHGEGFAHRDIKPKNVLIQQHPTTIEPSSWWVKLADFGISKRLGEVITSTSTMIGTPAYIAPELFQVDPESLLDIKYLAADMWALGVMAFFILTKSYPFSSPWHIFQYTDSPDTLFPHRLLDECHVSLDGQSFISHLMKPKPKERLDSNTALHHTWLQSWLPNAPMILDHHSESSTPSSGRTSFDGERGMTTHVSDITDLPIAFQMGPISRLPSPIITTESSNKVLNDKILVSVIEESSSQSSTHDQIRAQLLLAAEEGHEDVVKLLVEKGADITIPDNDGWTPVHAASSNGHVEVVKLLVENGADIMIPDNDGWTPVYEASSNGHVEVVKMFIENGVDITIPNNDGWTPVHAASDNGHVEVVKLLFENGADITIPDNDGWTPVYAASRNGHVEGVKLLVENGADITIRNNDGWTSIYAASSEGHVEVVKLLIENGVDIMIPSKAGWTPVYAASSNGYIEVVKLLVEKGADITIRNNDGWTPVHAALINGHVEVVNLLRRS